MKINIEESNKLYLEKINNDIQLLNRFSENLVFNSMELKIDEINKLDLSDLDKINALYLIEVENISEIHSDVICKRMKSLKKKKKSFKFPRVNDINAEKLDNSVLYIGKSKGNLKSRMEYHLGLKSKSTYALHLKQWSDHPGLKFVRFKLHYTFIPMNEEDLNSDALELMESSLHYMYKPLLGRSGH